MLKNIKLSTITAIALLSIIGCGGSGSSSSSDIKTGTGYYVDNAVKGIDYVCGSEKGKTDADGTFTFEKDKDCKFSLAGITLRTTKADDLVDGKKVVEDNPKVARFLQSIDSDNNLSNGIQITDKVLTALTKALEESDSVGKLPEDNATLTVVVQEVENTTGVIHEVKTPEAVQAHLNNTQKDVIKELLAGKTVYVVNNNEVNNNVLDKVTFSKDMTSITWLELEGSDKGDGGTDSLSLNGKVLTLTPSDPSEDGIETITINEIKEDYILATFREEDDGKVYKHTLRVYFDETKARSYLNGNSTDLKTLLAGKTLYTTIYDKHGTLESWTFDNKFSSVTWKELVGGNDTEVGTIIGVNKSTFTVREDDDTVTISIKEKHDDYLVVTINDSESSETQTIRVYFNEAKAKAYFLNNGTTDLKTLLAGKTLYTTIYDKHGTLESWTFDNKFSSVTWKELVGGNDTEVGTIIGVNKSTFTVREDDDTVTISIKEKHDDYLVVTINDSESGETQTIRVYFNEVKARAYFL